MKKANLLQKVSSSRLKIAEQEEGEQAGRRDRRRGGGGGWKGPKNLNPGQLRKN